MIQTEIYGSFATRLSMPWSDIDMIVSSKSNNRELISEQVLSQIDQKFREQPSIFGEIKYIQSATVPVIKATCTNSYGSKKIDITFQDGKHSGPECVRLVAEYLEMYECLRYLVLPLKQLIFNSQLNDPYQGGLTSYALVLMIVSFLQMRLYSNIPIDMTSPTLGSLYIEFLSFYSNYDYVNSEIKPLKPTKDLPRMPYEHVAAENVYNSIVIVDPLNTNNNVARSTYRYQVLKVTPSNLERISFLLLSSRLFH